MSTLGEFEGWSKFWDRFANMWGGAEGAVWGGRHTSERGGYSIALASDLSSPFECLEIVNIFLVKVFRCKKIFWDWIVIFQIVPRVSGAYAPEDNFLEVCKEEMLSFIGGGKVVAKENRDVVVFLRCEWCSLGELFLTLFPLVHSSMDTVYPRAFQL